MWPVWVSLGLVFGTLLFLSVGCSSTKPQVIVEQRYHAQFHGALNHAQWCTTLGLKKKVKYELVPVTGLMRNHLGEWQARMPPDNRLVAGRTIGRDGNKHMQAWLPTDPGSGAINDAVLLHEAGHLVIIPHGYMGHHPHFRNCFIRWYD